MSVKRRERREKNKDKKIERKAGETYRAKEKRTRKEDEAGGEGAKTKPLK